MRRFVNSKRGNDTNGRWGYVLCAALLMSVMCAVAGCASGPQYLFNVDRAANFGSYRTFGFYDERAYQSVAHRHLKSAITREMQARGYRHAEQPDLLINIHVLYREDADGVATASNYYQYRRDRYSWRAGVETVTSSYADGTLNIDVVDRAAHSLLWEGIAVGSVSQRMYESLEGTIDIVTEKLFEGFPVRKQSPS